MRPAPKLKQQISESSKNVTTPLKEPMTGEKSGSTSRVKEARSATRKTVALGGGAYGIRNTASFSSISSKVVEQTAKMGGLVAMNA